MRLSCLLIIAGAYLANACVPSGGGASCGAPPCPPPAPSCGFTGCSPPAAPQAPICSSGGVGCSPPQPPPLIVSCGPTGCSPPVAPSAPNCGSAGCVANTDCGSTGCSSSNNNGNSGDIHYQDNQEYYQENESESDNADASQADCGSTGCSDESVTKAYPEAEETEVEYESTDAAPATDAPAAPEETEQPAATDAPAEEETDAPAETDAPVEEETNAPAEPTEASAYTDSSNAEKSGAENSQTEVTEPDHAPCQFLTCNFEKETLCLYQNRGFEHAVNAATRAHRHTEMDSEHPKPWVAWTGKFGNRVTGIIEAQEGSTFAACYLKPGETSVLESDILSADGQAIQFDAYEATEDVALRMCCDSVENCKWETPKKAEVTSRAWREVKSTCPSGTKKVLFVCQNSGQYQGACGLDNIKVVGSECLQVTGKKTQGLEPFALAS